MTHKITRRDFIKVGAGAGVAAAALAGCQSPRRWVTLEPYVRPPEEQLAGQPTWYASTCRQCPAGCGIVVRIMNGRAVKIEGNPEHPLNRGKLCARGQAGLQVLYNPDRLVGPVRQGQRDSGQYQPVSWEDALALLQSKLAAAGDQVAVWGGARMSGHLFDLFSRLTAALGARAPLLFDLYTAFHGYDAIRQTSRDVFGIDALPSYDLANADVVFCFGADFAGTWLSAARYGLEYGRLRSQPLGKRGYLVQFEPRMSTTGAKADRWLPVRPGSEGLVAQAIASLIAEQGLGAVERVNRARAVAAHVSTDAAAKASDIAAEQLMQLAHLFATTERSLAIPGSALAGQADAADAVRAVQTLNWIVGRTGQPGGPLLSPLAPPVDQGALVKAMPSTFDDVRDLIARMQAGEVQVLLVYGANPVYELPTALDIGGAIAKVPFVVSFATIPDETAALADLLLPDHTYLEAWGYDVIAPNFGVPVIGSQQPVVTPYFDTRSTADVLLAAASGIPALAAVLPWADEVAFLKQVVAQLPPGAAWAETGEQAGADARWARFLQHGGWWPASPMPAGETTIVPANTGQAIPAPIEGDARAYPFFLHLYMSVFLGDGHGASQPWLQGSPDPLTTVSWQTWVELNPVTAHDLGVRDGDIVRVTSPHGELEAPVYIYPAIRPDTVAIPLGQGHSAYGRYARNRGSNPMRLVGAPAGAGLNWAAVRVAITPMGRNVALAKFESVVGT